MLIIFGKKVKLQSTISNLQAELELFKNQSNTNKEMIEEEKIKVNEIAIQGTNNFNSVDRLDKMSRIGTSCSYIGNLGNLESGTFLLDTDGLGKAEAPYEVSDNYPKFV